MFSSSYECTIIQIFGQGNRLEVKVLARTTNAFSFFAVQNCNVILMRYREFFNALKYVYQDLFNRYEAILNMFILLRKKTRGNFINVLFSEKVNDLIGVMEKIFPVQFSFRICQRKIYRFLLFFVFNCTVYHYDKYKKCYIYIYECTIEVCMYHSLLTQIRLIYTKGDLQRSRVIRCIKWRRKLSGSQSSSEGNKCFPLLSAQHRDIIPMCYGNVLIPWNMFIKRYLPVMKQFGICLSS